LLATAQRLLLVVINKAALVVARAVMVADTVVVAAVDNVDRLATLAAVTDTCLVIAPRDRSATTVVM
jgi:hypothetical protein